MEPDEQHGATDPTQQPSPLGEPEGPKQRTDADPDSLGDQRPEAPNPALDPRITPTSGVGSGIASLIDMFTEERLDDTSTSKAETAERLAAKHPHDSEDSED